MAAALGLFENIDHPRLFDRLEEVFRTRHNSRKTAKAYTHWIGRFIRFHGGTHPRRLREPDVNVFLTSLAVRDRVAPSTQNQALQALLFLYRHVLGEPLDHVAGIVRARRAPRLPVVLSRSEAESVLLRVKGVPLLACLLLYGTGMRISEALSLRVKDLDFERMEIVVRSGKGDKDRVTMMPEVLRGPLERHLEQVRRTHEADLAAGLGRVPLPYALARKYRRADREWAWQWVFPATSHYVDRVTGVRHRWHLHESVVQKAVRAAAAAAGTKKHVTAHTFRHSFATHVLEDGYDIRTVQELLGHDSVRTTQKYTHVLNRGGYGVRSPLDSRSSHFKTPTDAYTDQERRITTKDRSHDSPKTAARSPLRTNPRLRVIPTDPAD